MSNQAENNQEVQVIELTTAQYTAISVAMGYLLVEVESCLRNAHEAKESGLDCVAVFEGAAERKRKQVEAIDAALKISVIL